MNKNKHMTIDLCEPTLKMETVVRRLVWKHRGWRGLEEYQEWEYFLVLDRNCITEVGIRPNGSIHMGNTEAFLSPKKAAARLYEAGYVLPEAAKVWPKITAELLPIVETI